MTEAGLVQRFGSRVLRMFGVTRRHHLDRLAAEHRWVVAELERVHRRIAERGLTESDGVGVGASPDTAPDPATAVHELVLRRRQLAAALRELDFHARHWERAVSPDGGHGSAYQQGFAAPAVIAASLPAALPAAGVGRRDKTYAPRPLVSGLTARQAFHLEALCLSRLAERAGDAAGHFPRIIAVDAQGCRLTMTDQGCSLDRLDPAFLRRIAPSLAQDGDAQLVRIVRAMEDAAVVHLDSLLEGVNLTVDEDGVLSLIDFDIATIDHEPFSAEIAARHADWQRSGGYAGTLRELRAVLSSCIQGAG